MPPLITREEALQLGELEDHAEIEALVERAWRARLDNFGDSTDMCSLVNAKSGGCAEDCGFCAQSRFAEADTPMHAMMSPEQILEHAQAAEAAGAHRFCMVTQGQGLSKRDFETILEGARLVAENTNLKRCASVGHLSGTRAKALKDAGIQRVHHNVETAESYYPEVSSTVRYEGRIRTIDAVREAGLETCVGGILNLGETREQRVEMAFELAAVEPTSVPINLLNPRPGTKFGDREYMDPWEAVKWVAIFRLIIPEALFRLCGGRNENLGTEEFQRLAVKAGLNGVMMGNFLTTLGSEPEWDRALFEELGLNVARQDDNGANPRPDNRSGWLEGETPHTPVDELIDSQDEANFWDPATQLRHRKKSSVPPRPDGAPNAFPQVVQVDPAAEARPWRRHERDRGAARRDPRPRPLPAHALRLRPAGAARAARRQAGAAAVLEQLPRPGRPPARARGGRRGGDALRRRLRRLASGLGQHDDPPPARGAAGGLRARRGLPAVRLGLPRQRRRRLGARARGRRGLLRLAQPREHRRRLPPVAGGDVRLRPPRHGPPRVGPARGRRARQPDRHRRRLLDGRGRRAARADRRAGAALRRARDGRRGARHRRLRARRPRRRRGRGAGRRGRRDRRHARQGARLLRCVRLLRHLAVEVPDQHRPHLDLLHRAVAARRGRRDGRARPAARAAAPGREAAAQRQRAARRALARRGCRYPPGTRRSCR